MTRHVWIRRGGRLIRQTIEYDCTESSLGTSGFDDGASISRAPVEKRRKLQQVDDGLTARRSSACNQPKTITDLPEECIVSILSFLKAYEICRVASVCKRLHEVSLNRALGWNANFYFRSLVGMPLPREPWNINEKKRKQFYNFLSQRKAKVTSLSLVADINKEIRQMLRLLEKCNVKNLKDVDIRWKNTWEFCLPKTYLTKVMNFQKFLGSLSQHCPNLTKLDADIDSSFTSALAVSKLESIQWLKLYFCLNHGVDNLRVLSQEALDKLLSLPRLKVLKLIVSLSPAKAYTLKSNTLEMLDLSRAAGFQLKGLELPRLNNFQACHTYVLNRDDNVCLFDMIEKGCPVIQCFNETKASAPGFHNFGFAQNQLRMTRLCYCKAHIPWRIFI